VTPTPTEEYVDKLTRLKTGDLGLLRTHSGQGLDESVDGFDLFAGLWWPLRKKNQRAPRRSVAWLIAKLYAFRQIERLDECTLARQLRQCQPVDKEARERFDKRFDRLLILPLDKIEPALQWALDCIYSRNLKLDWVRLTDDLSIWERESTRLKWANEFLGNQITDKGEPSCLSKST
jgi:CRISPR type I-E-associated protein CasB/Cse2